jgi:osmotically-inducible protein OsmY
MTTIFSRKTDAERAKAAIEDAISKLNAPDEASDLRARLDDAGSRIGDVGNKLGELPTRLGDVGGRIGDAGNRIVESGNRIVESSAETARTVAARAREAASGMPIRIQVGQPRRRPILPLVGLGIATAAVGAVLAYILDPVVGRSRRAALRDRFGATARQVGRWSASQGRRVAATTTALRERSRANEPGDAIDEVALVSRVKSELFRDADIDKGAINVNAERDVVFLRGTAANEDQVREIGRRVEGFAGVRKVVNLLHLPGAPVPVMAAEEDQAEPSPWGATS